MKLWAYAPGDPSMWSSCFSLDRELLKNQNSMCVGSISGTLEVMSTRTRCTGSRFAWNPQDEVFLKGCRCGGANARVPALHTYWLTDHRWLVQWEACCQLPCKGGSEGFGRCVLWPYICLISNICETCLALLHETVSPLGTIFLICRQDDLDATFKSPIYFVS